MWSLVSKEAVMRQLQTHLDEIIIKENLKNCQYNVTPGSKNGDNYIGIVYRVALTGECEDGTQFNKSLIYKCQPSNEAKRKVSLTEELFEQEALFYNEVLPSLLKFLHERGVKNEFNSFPKKCYYAGNELLVTDMCAYGYFMEDKMKPYNVAQSRLVMQELGKLHAISFALRDQRPEEFKRLVSVVQEEKVFNNNRPHVKIHFERKASRAITTFFETTKIPNREYYKQALKKYQKQCFTHMVTLSDAANSEPYAVINHGDCSTNNILFKYKQDGTSSQYPVDVCFIDYQVIRYASPINDIAHFIYCCTDHEVRQEHHSDLMDAYYTSFSRFLNQLGSDPEKLYPLAVFQDQLQRHSQFGLGMALLIIPLWCQPENLPKMDEATGGENEISNILEYQSKMENVCNLRINAILTEMVDKKYISC